MLVTEGRRNLFYREICDQRKFLLLPVRVILKGCNMYGLRIILADTDPAFRKHLKEKLHKAGYMVVGETSDGRSALQMIFNVQPDLVIMNARMPGRNGLEVAKIVEEHRVAPVILVTEINMREHDELKEALEYWLISYILKPVDEINLFPAIEVSVASFKKICMLEEQNRKLKHTLETRKILERAKGLLAEFKGMTEQEAFKYIQKLSMDRCQPIRNIAKQIIAGLEAGRMEKGSDHA